MGQVIDGRYEVLALLARGGMATVYEAVDLRLDRVVALKVMHPHLAEDPDFVTRFEREAKAAARLTHPHVVGVYDQGRADGLIYLAMEFVPGRTLREVMKQFGPLSPEQALVLLDPVLEALQAAHDAGFVHRDIKPENVLISDDGKVKVADFGLARALATSNSSATQGVIIGTVSYLSPEQVERGDADARSDVYAAGILLFEMVTGQVPHAGDSPLSVAYQHVNNDVPAPSSIREGIAADVDALVITATRRDPDARYGQAEDFLADVHRVQGVLPQPRPFADSRDTLVVDASEAARIAAGGAGRVRTAAPVINDTGELAYRNPRRRWPWIAGIIAVILVVAAGAGWYLANTMGPHVPAPSVVGQTSQQAATTLATAGLSLVVGDRQYSETVPKDQIISEDPVPGAPVREHGTVSVTVSLGPLRYAVPDVTGKSPADAASAITAAKLTAGPTVPAFSDSVPSGQVSGTDPVIGTQVKPGTTISILVSKGPKPVPLPSVVGQQRTAAEAALTTAGVTVAVTEQYAMKIPSGQVISQSPAAGTVVNSGTSFSLTVSKGPPPVTVPRVVDLHKSTAIAELRKLGFVPHVVSAGFTPLNRVYSQSPAPGTQLPKGSVVTIRIV